MCRKRLVNQRNGWSAAAVQRARGHRDGPGEADEHAENEEQKSRCAAIGNAIVSSGRARGEPFAPVFRAGYAKPLT